MPETTKKEPVKKTTHAPRLHTGAVHVAREPKAATAAKPVVAKAVRYIEAVGRRKTAIARVRISPGTGKVAINDMDATKYFTLPRLVAAAIAPLVDLKLKSDFDMTAKVSGGGIHAQAEAVRLGVARAIVLKNPEWKKRLRAVGYMTRDSRMVERKKYGKLKARRSPQWAKR
jgi:small subunit ribosomal protein S9